MYGSYAQFIPEHNIKVASILVEDIHSRNPYWKVFSSSQWCWEDTDKWIEKWQNEYLIYMQVLVAIVNYGVMNTK